ncbi:flagellar protein FliT [Brevibacillus humidisoli]|uniref:flagellar protein FliT n=1 Tax=Brevibacillus humidisoli TaxID=2895522 RepID=UPI001E577740|nr:flagellar protein FliT [Brevibacillus humidisoli]UFJ40043.1 flagellar protein FliT [Brevibacillus humidisoli]
MSSLTSLCERLLETTLKLEAVVSQSDSDAELWSALLEEREGIMDQISQLLSAGEELSATMREQYVEKADEVNRRIRSHMTARKDAVHDQIVQLQRTKQVRRHYANSGPNGYGAFFDKRK